MNSSQMSEGLELALLGPRQHTRALIEVKPTFVIYIPNWEHSHGGGLQADENSCQNRLCALHFRPPTCRFVFPAAVGDSNRKSEEGPRWDPRKG
jgi:hypothetical protein